MDDEDNKEKTSGNTKKKTLNDNNNINNENAEEPDTKLTTKISDTTINMKLMAMEKNEENDWKETQFYLAEIESAPKHLFSYTSQEKLSKILGAYSEQNPLMNSELIDGPSCSKLVTAKDSYQGLTKKSQKLNENGLPKIQTTKSILKKEQDINVVEANGTSRSTETQIAMEANDVDPTPAPSVRSIGSLVCRICHNSENPERLVSPCLCKGTLSFVHIHCLERWISTSRSTVCELCQFQYNTEQTLRYTCIQSLRMWYSRSMSRRALQEDCQMFSLLTLVAFGIIGTLLVGIQYYFIQGRHWGLSSMWTKGWLLFFLFTTVIVACSLILLVYFINIYMIIRSQLAPWYRWWQSARDIKLILENRKPFKILPGRRIQRTSRQPASIVEQQSASQNLDGPQVQPPMASSLTPPSPSPATVPSPLPMQPVNSTECAIEAAIASNAICGGLDCTRTLTSIPPTIDDCGTQKANKLQILSELTRTAAEIIEIPLEAFDSNTFDYITTNK